MGRMTTLIAFLLVLAPGAFPQQSTLQTPEDAYTSRDLIAWSQLQTPQPTPQPLPPRNPSVPQPEQPQDQQAKLPHDSTTYQLEAGEVLEVYKNHSVRVVGKVRPNVKSIRILKIEKIEPSS